MTRAFILTDIVIGQQILHGSCAEVNVAESKVRSLWGLSTFTFCLIAVWCIAEDAVIC